MFKYLFCILTKQSQDVLKDEEVSVIKNSLLTAVILFTSCPKSCVSNNAIQAEFIEILKNGFYSDNNMVKNYYYYYFIITLICFLFI